MNDSLTSKTLVKPTEGPYKVRSTTYRGKRVLEIYTERYGFIIATLEPDDPEMRATAEIMAASWTAYRREMRAAEPPNAWQPITSAPKDGSSFLAWDPIAEAIVTCRYFDDDGLCVAWCGQKNSDVTHWMPLPRPPSTKDATNGGMMPTCQNCGHDPCADWCKADEQHTDSLIEKLESVVGDETEERHKPECSAVAGSVYCDCGEDERLQKLSESEDVSR